MTLRGCGQLLDCSAWSGASVTEANIKCDCRNDASLCLPSMPNACTKPMQKLENLMLTRAVTTAKNLYFLGCAAAGGCKTVGTGGLQVCGICDLSFKRSKDWLPRDASHGTEHSQPGSMHNLPSDFASRTRRACVNPATREPYYVVLMSAVPGHFHPKILRG